MALPVFSAQISQSKRYGAYESDCFEKITFEYEAVDQTTFNVLVTTSNPKKTETSCRDVILFANTEIQHTEVFRQPIGSSRTMRHILTFEMNTPEAQADVGYGGIKAFAFCDDVTANIESLWNTLKFVLEPDNQTAVPPYLESEFLNFMNGTMGRDYEDIKYKREIQRVDIDPDTVQSGDFLPTFRTDGLTAMMMYGTGAAVGHSTMALRFDGELYVVESDDPVIKRTPWSEWLDAQEEKGY